MECIGRWVLVGGRAGGGASLPRIGTLAGVGWLEAALSENLSLRVFCQSPVCFPCLCRALPSFRASCSCAQLHLLSFSLPPKSPAQIKASIIVLGPILTDSALHSSDSKARERERFKTFDREQPLSLSCFPFLFLERPLTYLPTPEPQQVYIRRQSNHGSSARARLVYCEL